MSWWCHRNVMTLSSPARANAGAQRARLWLRTKKRSVFSERENSSSCRRVETLRPVMIRNTPTPPMQPTRMCRGKKPMSEPSRKKPRRKNVRPMKLCETVSGLPHPHLDRYVIPVRILENANATNVVATISPCLSPPMSWAMRVAIM